MSKIYQIFDILNQSVDAIDRSAKHVEGSTFFRHWSMRVSARGWCERVPRTLSTRIIAVYRSLAVLMLLAAVPAVRAQGSREPDWPAIEAEALQHFQALVRMDTSDPPGREKEAADYLARVLESEGIPVQVLALETHRPNVIARLTGSGRKRPLLIMGHTDVVNVDPQKWVQPPFGAAREGGYVYGRGTLDDKDNVTAALMAMLTLKRANVALDRDVIFLAEAGEEGATRIGIEYLVNEHFAAIDAEFCYAEGGNVTREAGAVRYASIQTGEKIPNGIDLIARGPSGHGSVPLTTNAVAHLSRAVAAVTEWQPPVVLNDTTRAYFTRLAEIARPEPAQRYRDVLSSRSEGRRRGGRLAAGERAAGCLDAAHVDLTQHHSRRVSPKRHSVGGESHARRAHAAGRGLRRVSRAAEGGGERSGGRGSFQRLAADDERQTPRRRRVPHRQRSFRGRGSRHHETL